VFWGVLNVSINVYQFLLKMKGDMKRIADLNAFLITDKEARGENENI
jgi:hypothetical protein